MCLHMCLITRVECLLELTHRAMVDSSYPSVVVDMPQLLLSCSAIDPGPLISQQWTAALQASITVPSPCQCHSLSCKQFEFNSLKTALRSIILFFKTSLKTGMAETTIRTVT